MSRKRTRHCVVFLVTFVALTAVTLGLGLKGFNPSSSFIDYSSVKDGQWIKVVSANSTHDFLKLNYLRDGPVYRVGNFGMVHSALFRASAFDAQVSDRFFNYYTHFASVPDLVNIIAFAAQEGQLPSSTTIIQIPNPRLDGGAYLLRSSPELIHPALFPDRLTTGESFAGRAVRAVHMAYAAFKQRLNLQHAISGIFSFDRGYVSFDPDDCADQSPSVGIFNKLPQDLFRPVNFWLADKEGQLIRAICVSSDLVGQRRDGSLAGIDRDQLQTPRNFPEIGLLTSRHIPWIVRELQRIDQLISKAGSKAIFWVAPIAGAVEKVPLNQIMDRVIQQSNSLRIIDARYAITDLSYFDKDDKHPNERFFRWLADEIRRRGWLAL